VAAIPDIGLFLSACGRLAVISRAFNIDLATGICGPDNLAKYIVTERQDKSVNKEDLSKYKYFEGKKHYQFPVDDTFNLSRVNRYTLSSGGEFWYDPQRDCIVSDDDDLYIQTILRTDFGNFTKRILLSIDGLKIQFSKLNGASFDVTLPKSSDGTPIWTIEDIGCPLYFYTGHDDVRAGLKRPREERYQILSNASKFTTKSQQDRGVAFVIETLTRYGNSFSGAISGNEVPGCVELSAQLTS
jgi:hypothetical protein